MMDFKMRLNNFKNNKHLALVYNPETLPVLFGLQVDLLLQKSQISYTRQTNSKSTSAWILNLEDSCREKLYNMCKHILQESRGEISIHYS